MTEELRNGSDEYFELLFRRLFVYTYREMIETMKISEPDAKEAAIEALYEFRKKLINGKVKYGNVNYLFMVMARRKFIQGYNKRKKIGFLEDNPYEVEDIIDEIEVKKWSEEDFLAMEEAFKSLDDKCKDLLHKIYYKKVDTGKIAKKLGINRVAVRKRKQRCLDKMREYLKSKN